LAPALNITEDELTKGLDRLADALQSVFFEGSLKKASQ